MKIVITEDCVVIDGKRQEDEMGSRGFSPELLMGVVNILRGKLGMEFAKATGEVNNFIFDTRDRSRPVYEQFNIIVDALGR